MPATSANSEPIRLLIVDDNELFREGLALHCNHMTGVNVVGVAADGAEAVALALDLQPDVALVDISMPGMDGIQATAKMMAEGSCARILMLTAHQQPRLVFDALKAGAVGYLLKNTRSSELSEAIQAVSRGDVIIDKDLALLTLGDLARESSASGADSADDRSLTSSERAVLVLVAKGQSNGEIAEALGLAESTVANRLREIYQKLQVTNRTQAALVALRRGWAVLDVG